ncbi:hypothetical protein [Corynebacterium nuruki]|nr:hypothetical protein [Corynebacterium nuruki]
MSSRHPLKESADSASSKIQRPRMPAREVTNSMKDSPWLWKLLRPASPIPDR